MNHTLPRKLAPLDSRDLEHVFGIVGEQSWRRLTGQRLFITGGTGFIGKWLLSALIDADRRLGLGCHVVMLSRDPAAFTAAMPHIAGAPRLRLVQGDVRSFDFQSGAFDVIVHAATDVVAQNTPLETFSTCVDGTRRALEFAQRAGAREFLLLSSGAVYGPHPTSLDRVPENFLGGPDPLLPASAYGEGKRVSEWMACAQAADTGLQVKIARIYAQIGPYLPLDKHFAIGNFLGDAMSGRPIVIRSDGTPRRSWMHASDMTGWLWAMVLRGRSGVAYNVGGEESLSMQEAATRVARIVGSTAGVNVLKMPAPGAVAERYVPDVRRAPAELQLPPAISFDEAVARTARWFREHDLIS